METCRPGKKHKVTTTALGQALQMNVGQNACEEAGEHRGGDY